MKKMYIDGNWVEALDGSTRGIINPFNQEVIAQVAEGYDVFFTFKVLWAQFVQVESFSLLLYFLLICSVDHLCKIMNN